MAVGQFLAPTFGLAGRPACSIELVENVLRPAGWYPDPIAPTYQIFWDGDRWVEESKRTLFVQDEVEDEAVGEDGTLDGEVVDWIRYLAHLEKLEAQPSAYVLPEGLELEEAVQARAVFRIMAFSLVGSIGVVFMNCYGLPFALSNNEFLSLVPLVLAMALTCFVGFVMSPRSRLGDEGGGVVALGACSRPLSFAAPLFVLVQSVIFAVRVNPGHAALLHHLTVGFIAEPNFIPPHEAMQLAQQQAGRPGAIVAMVAVGVLLLAGVIGLTVSYETWKEPLGRRDLAGGLCVALGAVAFTAGGALLRLMGFGVVVLALVALSVVWSSETPWTGWRGWVGRLSLVASVLGFAVVGWSLALGV